MTQEKSHQEPVFCALSPEQIRTIYREMLRLDFPLMERKPYRAVQRLVQRGLYVGYALLVGERVVAYALLVRAESSDALLLDYLAVPGSAYKGQGLGSRMLAGLRAQLQPGQYLLGEIESLSKAKTDEQRLERERRWAFYQRNGWRMSGVHNHLLGVDYDIITCGDAVGDAELRAALLDIYRLMFGRASLSLILDMPPVNDK